MTGPDSTELAHKRTLLETYRKNLYRREQDAAQYGLDVPLHIANEIEFMREEIAKLTQELEACGPQLYQEALDQQETALTDRPAVLALGLGTDISGRVKEFLRQKGEPLASLADQVISLYVRAPKGKKRISKEDLPKVIADLHELRKDLEAKTVTELFLFYYGSISLAVAIGRVFSNWVPIKMYNLSQDKYELDMVIGKDGSLITSPDQ
jgi:hypothetical protein